MIHLSSDIRVPIERDNVAIQRIESLCIKCGKCRDVCKQEISVLGKYDLKVCSKAICVHCGQCSNVCPTGAIQEKKEFMSVVKSIANKNKKVVVLTSPAVRVALGEEFGMEEGSFVEKQMVAALRMLGVDYVFDTTFAADLTIMEEASELLERLQNGRTLPQFTSCCPAWVQFVETYYPTLIPNISTSKSPISMFGPTIKTYFANKVGVAMEDIICVALTPCTAKKAEIRREEMVDASQYEGKEPYPDVDNVITTRELAQWMKAENISIDEMEEQDYDTLMPRGSGAGIIFGNTGGVMEAALRSVYFMLTKEQPPKQLLNYQPVRGIDTMKEATVEIDGLIVKVAVIHTLAAVRQFLATKSIDEYHFIEVMTCKGGCIGGGGQPIPTNGMNDTIRQKRIASLYQADEKDRVRNAHDNQAVKLVYDEFYIKPLSEIAKKILHTKYRDRSSLLNENPDKYHNQEETTVEPLRKHEQWVCTVCGYVYDGDDFSNEMETYTCPICHVPKELFEIKMIENMEVEIKKQWICSVCGYVYDGADFDQESDDYTCPLCSVKKLMFEQK